MGQAFIGDSGLSHMGVLHRRAQRALDGFVPAAVPLRHVLDLLALNLDHGRLHCM